MIRIVFLVRRWSRNSYTEGWCCTVRLELLLVTLRAVSVLRDTSQFWQQLQKEVLASDLSTPPLQWAAALSCWEDRNKERTIRFPHPLDLSGAGQVATTCGNSSVKLKPSFRHCTANIFPWPSFCHGWQLIWKQQSVCSSKKWSPWVSAENYHWWQWH